MNDREKIMKSIEKSMKERTPIMIDHLALIDVNRYFSLEEVEKRRARTTKGDRKHA